ncbi:LysR family transcriptional regulator [Zhongshania sp. BJYM1]|uniref:LysR family transcriptional regulator n=1 Tax=Zhongshania aquatica TaxID=2965069 RepID=UPI0022B34213|nr:LysR family transcriptional regulator [Marortus sp. BJYM1]
MDIELARTFLEIVKTGSFIAAGERLHVTQTTVTARIRNLEGQLGCRLFVRNRAGAKVTNDGERFISHASQLVQVWEVARRELPLPKGADTILTLGGEASLWNPLLLEWLHELRINKGDVGVRIEVAERSSLHEKIERGVLDAALVHQPDYWPGIQAEQVLEEKLIKVKSVKSADPYIYVDWGEHFCRQHDAALPELCRSDLYVDYGPLALDHLACHGGSGYFRSRVVKPYIDSGLVERIDGVPEFSYPIYVIYSRGNASKLMGIALEALSCAVEVAGRGEF